MELHNSSGPLGQGGHDYTELKEYSASWWNLDVILADPAEITNANGMKLLNGHLLTTMTGYPRKMAMIITSSILPTFRLEVV